MKMKILFLVLILMPVIMAIPTKRIDVFVFHSETCPACSQMIQFLDAIYREYPTMVLHLYDVKEEENKKLYDLFKEVYSLNIEEHPVPMVFIGKDAFRGYTATNLKLIDTKLRECLKEGCTIALTVEKDCIVIFDPTPTPVLAATEFLLPFLVAAGVFCSLNPYNSEIAARLKTWKSSFFLIAYFVTSLLLCFALLNAVFLAETKVFLRFPLTVLALIMGVLSIVSAVFPVTKIPESSKNALDELAADGSAVSLFSLGIGACILSLMYSAGIYLLVVYKMLFFPFSDRLQDFSVFNAVLLVGLILLCFAKPGKRKAFFVLVGAGSIILGIFSWMVW